MMLRKISVSKLLTLKRNPQYLTPKQMDSLKASILRDGFVAPILIRPIGAKFEVISGNHRFMAAKEIGLTDVPCVISEITDESAKRLAVNLNTIHGNPPPELLAPFLADMSKETLAEIHIEPDELRELCAFDQNLKVRLDEMQIPDSINKESPSHANTVCECPKCGRKHFKPV